MDCVCGAQDVMPGHFAGMGGGGVHWPSTKERRREKAPSDITVMTLRGVITYLDEIDDKLRVVRAEVEEILKETKERTSATGSGD